MNDIIYKFPLSAEVKQGNKQVGPELFTLSFLVLVALVTKYKLLCLYQPQ